MNEIEEYREPQTVEVFRTEEEIAKRIKSDLNDLRFLISMGDDAARKTWVILAREMVDSLEDMTKKNLDVFRRIARTAENWPVRGSRIKSIQDQVIARLEELQLAEGHELNYVRGKHANSHESKLARKFWGILDSCRKGKEWPGSVLGIHQDPKRLKEFKLIQKKAKKLPKLEKATLLHWTRMAQRLLVLQYGESFEKHQDFTTQCQEGQGIAKKPAWRARSDITRAFRQSFHSILSK